MQEIRVPRRVQFSSCDNCRRARVACDAGRNNLENPDGCTRCYNRGKDCTFEWMTQVKSVKINKRARTGSPCEERLPSPAENSSTLTSNSNGRGGSTTPKGHDPVLNEEQRALLHSIYLSTWETVFGNWMSRYGCPFVFGDENVSESSVSISSLCNQLDQWMAAEHDNPSPKTYTGLVKLASDEEKDRQIRQSLERVIHSYAARWLHLFPSACTSCADAQAIARKLWREARVDMLRVINRPSYRSMLTLYLFSFTPIPEGIPDEEEFDGVNAQVCVQAALQQVYSLRVRQKSIHFSGSKFSPTVVPKTSVSSPDRSFIIAENIVHWATLTFDTSASLTLSSRPMLSSGILSYMDLCWSLVKSCAELFHTMAQEWHAIGLPMTDTQATRVTASANAFKLLIWKLCAVLREALRDGYDEAVVNKIHGTLVDAIDQYARTYRTPVDACYKRMDVLSQETRLRWYDLNLHVSLAILLATDAVETRPDLLTRLIAHRTDAERYGFRALVFGAENTYDLSEVPGLGPASVSTKPRSPIVRVSLLSADPYPHHVVASVQLLRRAIDRDVASKKLDAAAHARLLAVLNRALKLLPDSSKSVRAARKQALSQNVDG